MTLEQDMKRGWRANQQGLRMNWGTGVKQGH